MQSVLQSLIALVIIIPLIVLTVYLLRRFSHFPLKLDKTLKVVAQLPLSSKHQIVVVQMNTTRLTLGLSPNGMEILDKQTMRAPEMRKENTLA